MTPVHEIPPATPPQARRILLYGLAAVAAPLRQIDRKARLKMGIDRLRFRLRRTRVRYRNYVTPGTYNRGDHAIVTAVQRDLRRAAPDATLVPVDWGDLEAVQPTAADTLVVCGGGYFFPHPDGELPPRIAADLRVIQKTRVRCDLLGTGFNYLLSWPRLQLASGAARTLSALLEVCDTLTVRDNITKNFLGDFTHRTVAVTGDPALFLGGDQPATQTSGQRPINIGINVPFHGPRAEGWVNAHLLHFVHVLKTLMHEVDCRFFYFVHYDAEVLLPALMVDAGIPISVVSGDTDVLLARYAAMDVHVGGMLHSCILAAAVGTPAVVLAYGKKHYGFCELMGSLEYCVNADRFDADAILGTTLRLIAQAADRRESVVRHREALRPKYAAAVAAIVAGKSA